jgi:hypothetical protein
MKLGREEMPTALNSVLLVPEFFLDSRLLLLLGDAVDVDGGKVLRVLKAIVLAGPVLHLLGAELVKVPLAVLEALGVLEDVYVGLDLVVALDVALAVVVADLGQEPDAHLFARVLGALKVVEVVQVGRGEARDQHAAHVVAGVGRDARVVGVLDPAPTVAVQHGRLELVQRLEHAYVDGRVAVADGEEDLGGHLIFWRTQS